MGSSPPFISGKDVSMLTAMAFDVDTTTTEVANLAGLGVLTIAFKEAGG